MTKTCVIIPTYNEAKSIGNILNGILMHNLQVVVVDDGSTDSSAVIAKNTGAVVLQNEKNLGKGASLIKGFTYAIEQGFDSVITMDGDGQHLPKDIPNFLQLEDKHNSPVIIGNRMEKIKSMPLVRILANKFMSVLISVITHQEIPDSQCGFRYIKTEVLKKLDLTTSNYEIESEILIKSARLGFKIDSVAIETVYKGEVSRINPFLDTLRFFRFLIKEVWTTQY